MMTKLSPRQKEVLDFICMFRSTKGYSPSLREIGHEFRIGSLNAVTDHIKALIRKGYLTGTYAVARALIPTTEVTLQKKYDKLLAFVLQLQQTLNSDVRYTEEAKTIEELLSSIGENGSLTRTTDT